MRQDCSSCRLWGEAPPTPARSWWLQAVFGSLLHHSICLYLACSLVFACVSQAVVV